VDIPRSETDQGKLLFDDWLSGEKVKYVYQNGSLRQEDYSVV
jgi:hypothetical protein